MSVLDPGRKNSHTVYSMNAIKTQWFNTERKGLKVQMHVLTENNLWPERREFDMGHPVCSSSSQGLSGQHIPLEQKDVV